MLLKYLVLGIVGTFMLTGASVFAHAETSVNTAEMSVYYHHFALKITIYEDFTENGAWDEL